MALSLGQGLVGLGVKNPLEHRGTEVAAFDGIIGYAKGHAVGTRAFLDAHLLKAHRTTTDWLESGTSLLHVLWHSEAQVVEEFETFLIGKESAAIGCH